MARKIVPQISPHPFHITGRHHNRKQFPISLEDVWRIFEDSLYLMNLKYQFGIHSFVLMPNHFHLIASSENLEIGKVLCELMTTTSKEINRRAGNINQVWGSKHFKSQLAQYSYLLNTYKYVYQNPMRAGLGYRAETWKYSTLNGIIGQSKLIIPVQQDTILFNPEFDESELKWINQIINPNDLAEIRFVLRKPVFKYQQSKTRTPHHLEKSRI